MNTDIEHPSQPLATDEPAPRTATVLTEQLGDGHTTIEQACARYPVKLPYGIDRDGTPVTWDLLGRPNLLIHDPTDTDREEVMATLIAGAALTGAETIVVSRPDSRLAGFAGHPNVTAITEPANTAKLIADLYRQLISRYRTAVPSGHLDWAAITKMHPIVIVIDDLPTLTDHLAAGTADPDQPSLTNQLEALPRYGRRPRMHLVAATGSLNIEWGMLCAFTDRIALGPSSPAAAKTLWNLTTDLAPLEHAGRGRGIAMGERNPIAFRALHTPDPGSTDPIDQQDSAALRPATRLYPRRTPEAPSSSTQPN